LRRYTETMKGVVPVMEGEAGEGGEE